MKRTASISAVAVHFMVIQSQYISSAPSYSPTENILIKSSLNIGVGGSLRHAGGLPLSSPASVVAHHLSHHLYCKQK